jgi:GNAT superfamily N-acetyltransferase
MMGGIILLEDYRGKNRGGHLLAFFERQARVSGHEKVLVYGD